jgi:serine/threonine protein phosphatase PrpC
MHARVTTDPPDRNFILSGPQRFPGGHAEAVGRRPSMQDACCVVGDFAGPHSNFFGLFDGHGGTEVSIYCAKHLHSVIARLLRTQTSVERAITEALSEVNSVATTKWPAEGSCVALALIQNDTVWAANVGDSRVLLVEDGIAKRLTVDHKASDPDERKKVIERGGHFVNERVNGVLMLARAIGDGNLGKAVSCEPMIRSFERKDGMWLILACDGVWDVMRDQEAAAILMEIKKPVEAAKAIRDEALNRGSSDNVSCMIIDLTPRNR